MKNIVRQTFLAATAVAALGFAGAANAATVGSILQPGSNHLSDNSVDQLIKAAGTTGTQVNVGDRLRGTFQINSIENPFQTFIGGNTSNNELTGIFDLTIVEKKTFGQTMNAGGTCAQLFCWGLAPTASFAAEMAAKGFSNTTGAMVAFFEDPANNYDRTSPLTIAQIEARATDGNPFWLLGLGAATDFWNATGSTDNIAFASSAGVNTPFGAVQAGVSLLDNPNGPDIKSGAVACTNLFADLSSPPFGTNGADVCGQGALLAKGNPAAGGSVLTPYDSLDDVNFDVVLVPEPTTLGILGLGLAGLGFATRRRKVA